MKQRKTRKGSSPRAQHISGAERVSVTTAEPGTDSGRWSRLRPGTAALGGRLWWPCTYLLAVCIHPLLLKWFSSNLSLLFLSFPLLNNQSPCPCKSPECGSGAIVTSRAQHQHHAITRRGGAEEVSSVRPSEPVRWTVRTSPLCCPDYLQCISCK